MLWEDMALVGRIARAHGIKGQVIVNPETDFLDARFQPGAELFVQRGGSIDALRITSARFQNGRPVIGLEGVASMNDAEALAGLELRIPADRLMPLEPGTFYHHDLVGCRVETVAGDVVGTVTDVEAGAGGSRLVIDSTRGEVLVPLAADICTDVDVAAKRIVVNAPDGLLDLNVRGSA